MIILIHVQNIIPSLLYGGTERVVWCLGKELHKLGHKITFLAPKGSYCDFAEIIIFDPTKSLNSQIPYNIDLVHINDDNLKESISKPYIVTINGNPDIENTQGLNCVFVSKNHANRYQSENYVYNGLDWDMYKKPILNTNRSYFHFLGNAAWKVKNLQGAISIIKQTPTEKLTVMGGTRWHPNTFSLSNRVSYLGMVDDIKKAEIMNQSKGLIFPVTWHEPFGLAIIESLFYGCPIFGSTLGSLAELIPNEVGFLSNSEVELSKAILESERFSKNSCNEYVVEEFNARKMALAYLEKYEQVLNKKNFIER